MCVGFLRVFIWLFFIKEVLFYGGERNLSKFRDLVIKGFSLLIFYFVKGIW